MSDVEFSAAEHTGLEILTRTGDGTGPTHQDGRPRGTVAADDGAANALLVAPNPVSVDGARGVRVEDDTTVSYGDTWLTSPQVEVESLPDVEDTGARGWPFTHSPAGVEGIEDDEIRLVLTGRRNRQETAVPRGRRRRCRRRRRSHGRSGDVQRSIPEPSWAAVNARPGHGAPREPRGSWGRDEVGDRPGRARKRFRRAARTDW